MKSSGSGRRNFTKQFKKEIAQRVQSGTPAADLARTYNLQPDLVRTWRDELCDLGRYAFPGKGMRTFTREEKENAVRLLEQGTPLNEVARLCRVTQHSLRRWRHEFQTLGSDAFASRVCKKKMLIYRFTEDEHKRLKKLAKSAGARSVSVFVRSRLLYETREHSLRRWRHEFQTFRSDAFSGGACRNKILIFRLTDDEDKWLKKLAKSAGARRVSDFVRFRLLYETSER